MSANQKPEDIQSLTHRQKQVYEFIKQYVDQHGISPTDREVADYLGIKSRGVAHRYIQHLVDVNLISKVKGRRRNIRLIDTSVEAENETLPILGEIAAGSPLDPAPQTEVLNIVKTVFGINRFLLSVKGDSMCGDNICDGDYVICERRHDIRNGSIVAAIVDDRDVTLKRIQHHSDNTVSLVPSNPAMMPLVYSAERVNIQGVYLGLLRLDAMKPVYG